MSSPSSLSTLEKQELAELQPSATLPSLTAAAATFLILGALIVITNASLCLALPGVNVVNQVVLPAVVPGVLAIVVSLPFILLSVQHNQRLSFARKRLVEKIFDLLDSYEVPEMEKNKGTEFFLENFFNPSWTVDYRSKILTDLSERLGSNKDIYNSRQLALSEILEEARRKIYK